jgi:tellurite resistance protein
MAECRILGVLPAHHSRRLWRSGPAMSDIFKERERAFEAHYFRKQDEKLLAKMRERASLQEVAQALAEKLQVDDAELLKRVSDLGLDRETGPAILLAPLVQVAWAEGKVTERERAVVFEIAASRGVVPGSPAHAQLDTWLQQRPADELFETAFEVMKVAATVLPPEEREERIRGIVDACKRVAEASGGGLAKLLGMGSAISGDEASVLEGITVRLRSAPQPRR